MGSRRSRGDPRRCPHVVCAGVRHPRIPCEAARQSRRVDRILQEITPIVAGTRFAFTGSAMRQTILVVDDQPGTRRLVRNILERDGYSVVEAEDGPSAWRALHHRDDLVSLALIDVDLPGPKGRQVAEHLQMLTPLKVLFMSGHTPDSLILQGELAADAPLLPKPFKIGDLLTAVESRLS